MSAEPAAADDKDWSTGEAANDGGGEGNERILNQDEIDTLLGFGLGEEDDSSRTGVRAIINSALVSYERLPMLEIVFDRLVRLMTTSLRNFTSDNVEVSLDQISSIRFGDYLNSIPLPAIIAVFRAQQLDNFPGWRRSTRLCSIRSSMCCLAAGAGQRRRGLKAGPIPRSSAPW